MVKGGKSTQSIGFLGRHSIDHSLPLFSFRPCKSLQLLDYAIDVGKDGSMKFTPAYIEPCVLSLFVEMAITTSYKICFRM